MRLLTIALVLSTLSMVCHTSPIYDYSYLPTAIEPAYTLAQENCSLTWTSRWSATPQSVMNESEIVGDHVVLNATFADDLNVIRTQIMSLDGFTYSSTRQLLNITINWFPYTFDPDDFVWVHISGLRRGMPINISCDFTNGDSDFFGWPSDMPMSERDFNNDIFEYSMCTGEKPETARLIWSYDCDTLDIAAHNYDGTPGNWTVNLVAGTIDIVSVDGRTAFYDTYTRGYNSTLQLSVIGKTSTNDTLIYNWQNVTFGNYFTPQISVNYPEFIQDFISNITWTSTDLNSDDVHFYDVWVTADGGVSFQLLGRNLTQTWFLWNATGFLQRDDFIFRIRAYSVDLVTYPGPFYHIPQDYFPGDYADGFSPYFTPTGLPQVYVTDILINPAPDVTCLYGATWNNITWILQFNEGYETPEMFTYVIHLNDTYYKENEWVGGDEIIVFIDDLPVGNHRISITYWNPGSNGGMVSDSVLVHVYAIETPSSILGIALIGAVSGFGIVVGAYVVYIIKTRKPEPEEPEESEEDILSQLL